MVSVLLALLLVGAIEFGLLFGDKIQLAGGAAAGARFAAQHPLLSTPAAAAASNTIQGQVRGAGGTSALPSTDTAIFIEYLNTAGTVCGVSTAGAFSGRGSTQSQCVVDGNLVRVTVTNTYPAFTALFAGRFSPNVTLSASAVVVMIG